MAANAGLVRHAELGQPGGDESGGLLLLERDFRVGVQMAAPGGEFFSEFWVHGW
jgi:hypothetical protein